MYKVFIVLFLAFLLSSCSLRSDESEKKGSNSTLFERIDKELSGVAFSNDLIFTEDYNPYTFKNFFNGGGVALGDVNNDGLLDMYFSGNLVDNALYINRGDFQFEDVSVKAGVSCADVWSSGVSMVDINGDGLLDIYVCKSGRPDVVGVRHNELFINSADGTFVEASHAYGLDFTGLAVHAVFFDYDLDGDLDCYLLNNSIRSVGGIDMVENLRDVPNSQGGNKLLKCMLVESGGAQKKYVDVTSRAGIYQSAIGFGLGVSVSDLNGDQWPDIFISNDFFEKDYLYINNQDGTFSETVDRSMAELSMGSMGADIADIDNDGKPDIFVTEMLPATIERTKTKIVFENYEKSQLATSKGYHRQFARNTLHHNEGLDAGSNTPLFSEISRYAGVDATEWSWGALIEDFDQDGLKDIFVANGLYKDLLDQDYLNFFQPNEIRKRIQNEEKDVMVKMFDAMPVSAYPNYYYKNNGNLTFSNRSSKSGLGIKPTYSNGSAYGDLDNDGDLDLVTNNIGEAASIYKNTSNKPSLTISLKGKGYNSQSFGALVTAYTSNGKMVKEVYPMRGFQSGVDYRVQYAFGDAVVDSIIITWPDHSREKYDGDLPDSVSVSYLWEQIGSQVSMNTSGPLRRQLLTRSDIMSSTMPHRENRFSDFDRVRTLPFIISNEGPRLMVADINKDGIEDVILSSSKGSPSTILLNNDRFLADFLGLSEINIGAESLDILVSDLDGNGYDDIYFANGSSEFGGATTDIMDQIYLCDSRGCSAAPSDFINVTFSSSAAVDLIDLDNDGDKDLIVAERLKPNAYGVPGDILRYRNENGKYVRMDTEGPYKEVGLMRDLVVTDINNDGYEDIVVAREYDDIEILLNDGKGSHEKLGGELGLHNHRGIWSRINVADIDGDGDLDILAVNIGENNRIRRLVDSLAVLYVNDFDQNGSVEAVLCSRSASGDYPISLRDDMLMQLPSLKKKALKYIDYAKMNMTDLITTEILDKSVVYTLNEYRSGIFVNDGGSFHFVPLPMQAQWTDQRAMWIGDLNNDGLLDIILGGNQYLSKPEMGTNAASYGQVFLQNEDNKFRYLSAEESGLQESGQIRDIDDIKIGSDRFLLIAKNNEQMVAYKIESR